MARRRWTLALIIICLPILATVISAFRIRDLPRSYDRKEKCDDCDVKVGHKLQSVKIESDKLKIGDTKKTVKDKQETNQQKAKILEQHDKPTHTFAVKSDEDEEDSDEHILNIKIGLRQENPKVNKLAVETKPAPTKSFLGFFDFSDDDEDEYEDENNDDDDDNDENEDIDDDDDDEEEKVNMRKIKKIISKKIDTIKESKSIDSSSSKEDLNIFQDDSSPKPVQKKIGAAIKANKNESKESKTQKEASKLKNSKEDTITYLKEDKYNGDKIMIPKIIPKIQIPLQNLEKNKAQHSKTETKTPEKKAYAKVDESDDDGEEDDEDDSNIDGNRKKNQEKPIPTSSQKVDKPKIDAKEIIRNETPKKTITAKEIVNTKSTIKMDESKSKPIDLNKKVEAPKKQEIVNKESKRDGKTLSTENEDKKVVVKDTPKSNIVPLKKVDKIEQELLAVKKNKESPKKPEKEIKPVKSSEESKDRKSYNKDEPKKVERKISPEPVAKNEKAGNIFKELKNDDTTKSDTKYADKYFTNKDVSQECLIDSEEIASKSDSNLKHVSDALHRRNLLKSEFEDFYAFFPTFAPNFSHIHNAECRRHGQILLRQLRGMKLWALNMLDATAKIPSGILQGNGIQLGDFDQCLESRARVQLESGSLVKVQGKYCLARVDVKADHPELEIPVYLAQAKNLVRSRLDDPGHFVPRFSTLSWGVCVPSACNPEDVELVVRDAIKHYQRTSGVVVRIKVDPDDCHVEDSGPWWEEWLELPTLLTLSFYGVVILVVLVATVQDFVARRPTYGDDETEGSKDPSYAEKMEDGKRSDNIISAFSLYRTINKLLAPGTTDEIACIHGVRAIATLALLVAHKFLPVAVMPYTNRLQITETVSSPLWSWCRAGWMYTDCFLLLSGALTSHRIITDNDSAAPRRLLSRYIRLTPALLAVVLFYAYIWDHLSSGPMWGTFVTKNAQVCREGWWWNLLYVQNYFGLEDMCTPQTHQLALDMQLTIIGGLIVWAIQVKENLALILFPVTHVVAAFSRYTTVRDHRLTLLAYHGVSVSQLYRTARLSYLSVLHRSTSYLVGLSLGLALRTPKKHGMFVYTVGWVLSSVLWGLVWWAGADSGSTGYRYNVTFAAQYAALAPIASSMAIAWIIYAVHNGSISLVSRILCCRPLVFISRLSYALFLCQFIIFLTNVATVKTSSEFTVTSLMDVKEMCLILLSSTILTLTLVIPLQSMHKISSTKSEGIASRKSSITLEPIVEETCDLVEQNHKAEPPKRQYLIAHREVLEEIPEAEIEYEMQREKSDGLEEILEEEEGDDDQNTIGDDLEIIEEEEEGGEEYWPEREEQGWENFRRRSVNEDNQDLEEWEWTANGRSDDDHFRYDR